MSYYMVFRSDQNLEYYPDNKPYSFKIKLRQNIELSGLWKIGLAEINLCEENKKEDTLFIYSNICEASFINGVNASLLRRVVVNNNSNTIFTSCYYIPVIKSEINEIEFKLEDEQGTPAKHIKNPVTIVVHITSQIN